MCFVFCLHACDVFQSIPILLFKLNLFPFIGKNWAISYVGNKAWRNTADGPPEVGIQMGSQKKETGTFRVIYFGHQK